jgi:hypothetical protein
VEVVEVVEDSPEYQVLPEVVVEVVVQVHGHHL